MAKLVVVISQSDLHALELQKNSAITITHDEKKHIERLVSLRIAYRGGKKKVSRAGIRTDLLAGVREIGEDEGAIEKEWCAPSYKDGAEQPCQSLLFWDEIWSSESRLMPL